MRLPLSSTASALSTTALLNLTPTYRRQSALHSEMSPKDAQRMLDPLDTPISLIPGYIRDTQTTLVFQEKVLNASEVGCA